MRWPPNPSGAPRTPAGRRAGRRRRCCGPSRGPGRRRRARPARTGGGSARPGARRRSRSRPGASPPRRGRERLPVAPRRPVAPSSASRRSASNRIAVSTDWRSVLIASSSRAISSARSSSSVSISSSPASARYRRPAALIRGASAKPSVVLGDALRVDAGDPHQRPQAGRGVPRRAPAGPAAPASRFSPTSGTRSATVASATRSSSRSSSAGSRPAAVEQRLRELVGDARRAEVGGVAADRRVHDRAVGQLVARAVVVRDDHVHAELRAQRDLGRRADAAVGRDQQRGAGRGAAPRRVRGRQPVAVVRGSAAAGAPSRRARAAPTQQRRRADAVDVVVAVHGDRVARARRGA